MNELNKTDKKPSKKGKRLLFVIPEWLCVELLKKSDELGMNTSETIREAVREFVKKS